MKNSKKDQPEPGAEPAVESDALRLSDIENRDSPEMNEVHGTEPPDHNWNEDEQVSTQKSGAHWVIFGAVAVGVAAAAVVGVKIACERRKSGRVYREAVGHLEDARDALISAASELPERGREVLHRVTNR